MINEDSIQLEALLKKYYEHSIEKIEYLPTIVVKLLR